MLGADKGPGRAGKAADTVSSSYRTEDYGTPSKGRREWKLVNRTLNFTAGGLALFLTLLCLVAACAFCQGALMISFDRVGQKGGMGYFTFTFAFMGTWGCLFSLLLGFVFSCTQCTALGVACGFMQPSPGDAAPQHFITRGIITVSVIHGLSAAMAIIVGYFYCLSEHPTPGVAFGNITVILGGSAAILNTVLLAVSEWKCLSRWLGLKSSRGS